MNVTDSNNYRGIALSSVFGKLFDLIFLNKYSDSLYTSKLQFGFKPRHSTSMCSMFLKGALAYYVVDGGSAFCTFLDATKAFDQICKLFRELLKRDLPRIYVRLLANLYTNNVAHISWNEINSKKFVIKMVSDKVVSLALSYIIYIYIYIYIDGLLRMLRELNVGCFIGDMFVGALAYADDINLLAPTPSVMRHLLYICEQYGRKFSIMFNANKSAWMYVTNTMLVYLNFSLMASA